MSSEEVEQYDPDVILSEILVSMDAHIVDLEELANIVDKENLSFLNIAMSSMKNTKEILVEIRDSLFDVSLAAEEPSFKENYSWLMKRYPDLAPRMKEILLKSSYGLK